MKYRRRTKSITGTSLYVWRKDEKAKALLRIKGYVETNGHSPVRDEVMFPEDYTAVHFEFQHKLWFAQLKQMIHDVGLRRTMSEKDRKAGKPFSRDRDSRYDTTYYFQKGHKRYGMLEETREILGQHPEYVVKILHDTGVLPVPPGHFA